MENIFTIILKEKKTLFLKALPIKTGINFRAIVERLTAA